MTTRGKRGRDDKDELNSLRILELPHDPSIQEIKTAYRRLAKKYHPDMKHSATDSMTFNRVKEAYDFLLQRKQEEQESKRRIEISSDEEDGSDEDESEKSPEVSRTMTCRDLLNLIVGGDVQTDFDHENDVLMLYDAKIKKNKWKIPAGKVDILQLSIEKDTTEADIYYEGGFRIRVIFSAPILMGIEKSSW